MAHAHAASHDHAPGEHTHGGHHHHGPGHHHHAPSNALGTAFALNLTFTLIELVGGVLTNSVAILSDAVHDLGDTLSLGLSWYFERLSHKSRDARYTYGYRRWSVAAALISSLVLLMGSGWVLLEAVPRLLAPEAVKAPGMVGMAVFGLLANGLAVLKLKGHDSPGEKAARLHLLEDVLGWVAVLIGSVVMLFTDWFWLDPLLSIGVSVFILRNVFLNLRYFGRILLQAVPADLDQTRLLHSIEAIPGVQAVHDFHLWTLDSSRHVASLHVVVGAGIGRAESLRVKHAVKDALRAAGIGHDTLELEYADEGCQLECC